MIKTILFDFDGVILDSMKIKGDGFVELFKEFPESSVEALRAYHYANGGVSRFAKIRYFFENILHTTVSEKNVQELAERFGAIIAERLYDPANLIQETVDFIRSNQARYVFHIVSGAEHQELNALCSFFKIDHYFKSIEGSPTTKSHLISNLLKQNHYKSKETLLIGDSINDYAAARANKILFFGYNNNNLRIYGNYIESFSNFQP